ncbi:hypothetical protein [Nocardia gipuzkoensis]
MSIVNEEIHQSAPDKLTDTTVVPPTIAPAQPTAPPKSCFPFNGVPDW